MSKFNPDFWEVSVSPDILESVLEAPDMLERLFVTPEESRAVQDRQAVKQQAVEVIRTQQEIAASSVSTNRLSVSTCSECSATGKGWAVR